MAEDKRLEGGCVPCAEGTQTRDWYAWLDLMPPSPDALRVNGEVLVPNPGVDPILVSREPQGINPRVLLMDVLLLQKPGIWRQVPVWKLVRYEKTGRILRYDQVDVFCDGGVIASFPVEDVH